MEIKSNLVKISNNDLVVGETYTILNELGITESVFRFRCFLTTDNDLKAAMYSYNDKLVRGCFISKTLGPDWTYCKNHYIWLREKHTIHLSTPEEKLWLEECSKQEKFIRLWKFKVTDDGK